MKMQEYSSGAVLYTCIDGVRHYVLVVERGGHCGLPKGHIEPGETPEEAAKREIWEETGVDAQLHTEFVRKIMYTLPNGNRKQVTYYLASFEGQKVHANEDELDEAMLAPFEKAHELLTYENNRSVLRDAHAYLEKASA